jgi:hypothetical protein
MHSFQEWSEAFKWESEDQKKGFFAFWKWWREQPTVLHLAFDAESCAIVAYFIQKDHESNQWWAETVGELVSRLEQQIGKLQERIVRLERNGR